MSPTQATDGELRRAREARAASVRAVFERAGFATVEPPLLQPADVFLDLSGEDIRRRLYVFTDPGGQELCLRPDLTIPTCRHYLATAAGGEARLCYSGAAFRFEPEGSGLRRAEAAFASAKPERLRSGVAGSAAQAGKPTEFVQTGAEFFGATDAEAADAEMLTLAVEAVRAGGLEKFDIEMGDLALFDALVDALDIPAGWRTRLKRHFWRPAYFKELVARLAANNGEGRTDAQAGLLAALSALDEKSAKSVIADVLDLARIAPVGGRSVAEIAERFLERAADASAAPLSKETAGLIDAFLSLSLAPKEAASGLRDLTKAAGVSIEKEIAALERRFALIEKKGVDLSRARFAPGFGRTLEYYTGFVFELRAGSEDAVAGGGRYDGLLQSLGAKTRIPAVGCAISGVAFQGAQS